MIAFLSGPLPPDRARPRASACTSPPASRTTSRRRSSATACRRCARCSSASASPTSGAGTYDAVAVAVDGTEANAQVFQVRDGVLSDRQRFYLDNAGRARRRATSPRSSCSSTTRARSSIPALIVVQGELADGSELEVLGEMLAERRGGPVEIRAAERGDKRRILDLAERNARLALDQEKLKAERRRQQRVEALDGAPAALELDALPVRIECFDISNLGGTHTVASMVVFEGGAPKKSDYRRFTIREVEGGDDFASMAEVLSRRYAQCEKQHERSPYDADRDASFAALPEPDRDRRRQGPARGRPRAAAGLPRRAASPSSRSPSGSRRSSCRASRRRSCSPHDTPELQLLQRVRDEAHRFAITHHRIRRDKAMTESIMDELPGHRAGAQARAAQALRLARGGARRHARGARGVPGCRRRSRATSTPTSTGPADERRRRGRDARRERPTAAGRRNLEDLVVISGFSGAGQVDGDERVRGRRLLLRRQPAAGDDPLARRAVPARGLEGRARGGRVATCAAASTSRRSRSVLDELDAGGARPPRAVPRRRRADAAQPLQGDAPPPPARAARAASSTASAPSASCSSRSASAPTRHRHHGPERARRCGARSPTSCSSPSTPGRLAVTFDVASATSTARRATPTSRSTCASCPTRTTSPSCAR